MRSCNTYFYVPRVVLVVLFLQAVESRSLLRSGKSPQEASAEQQLHSQRRQLLEDKVLATLSPTILLEGLQRTGRQAPFTTVLNASTVTAPVEADAGAGFTAEEVSEEEAVAPQQQQQQQQQCQLEGNVAFHLKKIKIRHKNVKEVLEEEKHQKQEVHQLLRRNRAQENEDRQPQATVTAVDAPKGLWKVQIPLGSFQANFAAQLGANSICGGDTEEEDLPQSQRARSHHHHHHHGASLDHTSYGHFEVNPGALLEATIYWNSTTQEQEEEEDDDDDVVEDEEGRHPHHQSQHQLLNVTVHQLQPSHAGGAAAFGRLGEQIQIPLQLLDQAMNQFIQHLFTDTLHSVLQGEIVQW
jgi:hypothetical protein